MFKMMRLLAAAALSVALGGCASYTDETRKMRTLFRSEEYREALKKLEDSGLKDQTSNRLLYSLEKAMIYDRLGEGAKARALFISADKIADELYTVSIGKQAASFIVNDSMTDYGGEDYEKVAIHTQMALSFLGDQDLAAARVQARKINSKLSEINSEYDDNKNRYAEDAFARYLAGVIYEARGEIDDAIIDYGKAIELYKGSYSSFVFGGVPDALVKAYWRLLTQRKRPDRLAKLERDFPKQIAEAAAEDRKTPNAGELVVVHEYGSIATKQTSEFVFGIGKQIVRTSFPVIPATPSRIFGKTGVQVGAAGASQGAFTSADNVQDMNAIARFCLEDRRLRTFAKQSARLLLKGQMTEQAYENFGVVGGLAANVYSLVTETADTRSWSLLPSAYFITRVRSPAGKHDIRVLTSGRTGTIETVTIQPGKIVLRRDAGG